MKLRRSLWLMLCVVALMCVPLSATAQVSSVYILIVDDFSGHMLEVVDAITASPVYTDVLRPIVDQVAAEAAEGAGLPFQEQGATGSGGESSLEGQAPAVPTLDLPYESFRSQIANANQSINAVIQERGLVNGEIEENNCAVIPEGESIFSTGGAGLFSTGGASIFSTGGAGLFSTGGAGAGSLAAQPHGVRVRTQLEELRDQYAPDAPIQLVEIDTEGFTTSTILTRIQDEIAAITSRDPGANIVINMSFAVVPCTTLGTLAAYDAMMREFDPQTAEDLAALQALFDSLIGTGVYSESVDTNDDMFGFLNEICPDANTLTFAGMGRQAAAVMAESRGANCQFANSGTIIPVAAAGNAGEAFPYYPAAWASIVSVSASLDSDPFIASSGLAPYSNTGRILLPGDWVFQDGTQERGTSFAAPRYSFLMALNLLGINNDFCGTGSQIGPALPDFWGTVPPVTPPTINDDIC